MFPETKLSIVVQIVSYISVFDEVGQMFQGHLLTRQMSLGHLSIVEEEPGKESLKFGQNRISNS